MSSLRVLLACPRFSRLAAWSQLLSSTPEVGVVPLTGDPLDILVTTKSSGAEVVVIDLPATGEDPGLCSHLLAEFPEVKVIAISESGEGAVLYERGTVRTPIDAASLSNPLRLIQSLER